jgi:hypothetical protein
MTIMMSVLYVQHVVHQLPTHLVFSCLLPVINKALSHELWIADDAAMRVRWRVKYLEQVQHTYTTSTHLSRPIGYYAPCQVPGVRSQPHTSSGPGGQVSTA